MFYTIPPKAPRARYTYPPRVTSARVRLFALHSLLSILTVCAVAARPAFAEEYRSETRILKARHSVSASATASHLDTEDARVGNVDTAHILNRIPDVRIRRSGGLNGPAYLKIGRASCRERVSLSVRRGRM